MAFCGYIWHLFTHGLWLCATSLLDHSSSAEQSVNLDVGVLCAGDSCPRMILPHIPSLDSWMLPRTELNLHREDRCGIIGSHARSFPSFRNSLKAWIATFNISTNSLCQNPGCTCVFSFFSILFGSWPHTVISLLTM